MTAPEITISETLALYRENAVRTADAHAPDAFKWAYQLHSYFKELRESEEGRRGLSALMSDSDAQVRRWAAVHCMGWERDQARATLGALAAGSQTD